jgi:hypothetical protein
MGLILGGLIMLAAILTLFWLMDRMQSPLLHRIAYSGLIARLAVLGAAFVILGLLMVVANFIDHF